MHSQRKRKQLLRATHSIEYTSSTSDSIADLIRREVFSSYNTQTSRSVAEFRRILYMLHDYNTLVFKCTYCYPISTETKLLLRRYVELESYVLYKSKWTPEIEEQVQERVFKTVMYFVSGSYHASGQSITEDRKLIFDEALKIFIHFADVSIDRFPAKILRNLLDVLGIVNVSRNSARDPSLRKLKEYLRDSDYGSDEDSLGSMEEAAIRQPSLIIRNQNKLPEKPSAAQFETKSNDRDRNSFNYGSFSTQINNTSLLRDRSVRVNPFSRTGTKVLPFDSLGFQPIAYNNNQFDSSQSRNDFRNEERNFDTTPDYKSSTLFQSSRMKKEIDDFEFIPTDFNCILDKRKRNSNSIDKFSRISSKQCLVDKTPDNSLNKSLSIKNGIFSNTISPLEPYATNTEDNTKFQKPVAVVHENKNCRIFFKKDLFKKRQSNTESMVCGNVSLSSISESTSSTRAGEVISKVPKAATSINQTSMLSKSFKQEEIDLNSDSITHLDVRDSINCDKVIDNNNVNISISIPKATWMSKCVPSNAKSTRDLNSVSGSKRKLWFSVDENSTFPGETFHSNFSYMNLTSNNYSSTQSSSKEICKTKIIPQRAAVIKEIVDKNTMLAETKPCSEVMNIVPLGSNMITEDILGEVRSIQIQNEMFSRKVTQYKQIVEDVKALPNSSSEKDEVIIDFMQQHLNVEKIEHKDDDTLTKINALESMVNLTEIPEFPICNSGQITSAAGESNAKNISTLGLNVHSVLTNDAVFSSSSIEANDSTIEETSHVITLPDEEENVISINSSELIDVNKHDVEAIFTNATTSDSDNTHTTSLTSKMDLVCNFGANQNEIIPRKIPLPLHGNNKSQAEVEEVQYPESRQTEIINNVHQTEINIPEQEICSEITPQEKIEQEKKLNLSKTLNHETKDANLSFSLSSSDNLTKKILNDEMSKISSSCEKLHISLISQFENVEETLKKCENGKNIVSTSKTLSEVSFKKTCVDTIVDDTTPTKITTELDPKSQQSQASLGMIENSTSVISLKNFQTKIINDSTFMAQVDSKNQNVSMKEDFKQQLSPKEELENSFQTEISINSTTVSSQYNKGNKPEQKIENISPINNSVITDNLSPGIEPKEVEANLSKSASCPTEKNNVSDNLHNNLTETCELTSKDILGSYHISTVKMKELPKITPQLNTNNAVSDSTAVELDNFNPKEVENFTDETHLVSKEQKKYNVENIIKQNKHLESNFQTEINKTSNNDDADILKNQKPCNKNEKSEIESLKLLQCFNPIDIIECNSNQNFSPIYVHSTTEDKSNSTSKNQKNNLYLPLVSDNNLPLVSDNNLPSVSDKTSDTSSNCNITLEDKNGNLHDTANTVNTKSAEISQLDKHKETQQSTGDFNSCKNEDANSFVALRNLQQNVVGNLNVDEFDCNDKQKPSIQKSNNSNMLLVSDAVLTSTQNELIDFTEISEHKDSGNTAIEVNKQLQDITCLKSGIIMHSKIEEDKTKIYSFELGENIPEENENINLTLKPSLDSININDDSILTCESTTEYKFEGVPTGEMFENSSSPSVIPQHNSKIDEAIQTASNLDVVTNTISAPIITLKSFKENISEDCDVETIASFEKREINSEKHSIQESSNTNILLVSDAVLKSTQNEIIDCTEISELKDSVNTAVEVDKQLQDISHLKGDNIIIMNSRVKEYKIKTYPFELGENIAEENGKINSILKPSSDSININGDNILTCDSTTEYKFEGVSTAEIFENSSSSSVIPQPNSKIDEAIQTAFDLDAVTNTITAPIITLKSFKEHISEDCDVESTAAFEKREINSMQGNNKQNQLLVSPNALLENSIGNKNSNNLTSLETFPFKKQISSKIFVEDEQIPASTLPEEINEGVNDLSALIEYHLDVTYGTKQNIPIVEEDNQIMQNANDYQHSSNIPEPADWIAEPYPSEENLLSNFENKTQSENKILLQEFDEISSVNEIEKITNTSSQKEIIMDLDMPNLDTREINEYMDKDNNEIVSEKKENLSSNCENNTQSENKILLQEFDEISSVNEIEKITNTSSQKEVIMDLDMPNLHTREINEYVDKDNNEIISEKKENLSSNCENNTQSENKILLQEFDEISSVNEIEKITNTSSQKEVIMDLDMPNLDTREINEYMDKDTNVIVSEKKENLSSNFENNTQSENEILLQEFDEISSVNETEKVTNTSSQKEVIMDLDMPNLDTREINEYMDKDTNVIVSEKKENLSSNFENNTQNENKVLIQEFDEISSVNEIEKFTITSSQKGIIMGLDMPNLDKREINEYMDKDTNVIVSEKKENLSSNFENNTQNENKILLQEFHEIISVNEIEKVTTTTSQKEVIMDLDKTNLDTREINEYMMDKDTAVIVSVDIETKLPSKLIDNDSVSKIRDKIFVDYVMQDPNMIRTPCCENLSDEVNELSSIAELKSICELKTPHELKTALDSAICHNQESTSITKSTFSVNNFSSDCETEVKNELISNILSNSHEERNIEDSISLTCDMPAEDSREINNDTDSNKIVKFEPSKNDSIYHANLEINSGLLKEKDISVEDNENLHTLQILSKGLSSSTETEEYEAFYSQKGTKSVNGISILSQPVDEHFEDSCQKQVNGAEDNSNNCIIPNSDTFLAKKSPESDECIPIEKSSVPVNCEIVNKFVNDSNNKITPEYETSCLQRNVLTGSSPVEMNEAPDAPKNQEIDATTLDVYPFSFQDNLLPDELQMLADVASNREHMKVAQVKPNSKRRGIRNQRQKNGTRLNKSDDSNIKVVASKPQKTKNVKVIETNIKSLRNRNIDENLASSKSVKELMLSPSPPNKNDKEKALHLFDENDDGKICIANPQKSNNSKCQPFPVPIRKRLRTLGELKHFDFSSENSELNKFSSKHQYSDFDLEEKKVKSNDRKKDFSCETEISLDKKKSLEISQGESNSTEIIPIVITEEKKVYSSIEKNPNSEHNYDKIDKEIKEQQTECSKHSVDKRNKQTKIEESNNDNFLQGHSNENVQKVIVQKVFSIEYLGNRATGIKTQTNCFEHSIIDAELVPCHSDLYRLPSENTNSPTRTNNAKNTTLTVHSKKKPDTLFCKNTENTSGKLSREDLNNQRHESYDQVISENNTYITDTSNLGMTISSSETPIADITDASNANNACIKKRKCTFDEVSLSEYVEENKPFENIPRYNKLKHSPKKILHNDLSKNLKETNTFSKNIVKKTDNANPMKKPPTHGADDTHSLKSCNSKDVCDKLDSLTSCNSRDISDKFDSLKSCNSRDVCDKLDSLTSCNSRDISDKFDSLKSCNSKDVCDKLDSLTSCNSRDISDKFDSLKSCNSRDVSDKLGNVELQQDFADNKNEMISNINVEMEESCIISNGECNENLSGITSNVKNKTEMHTFTEQQLHTNKCETSNQQMEAKIKEPEDLNVSSEEKCPNLSKNIEEKNGQHHFLHGSNIPLSNDQMITQKEESMPEQNNHSVIEIENPINFDVYTELSEKQQIVDGLSYKMLETGCPENSSHPIATVASEKDQLKHKISMDDSAYLILLIENGIDSFEETDLSFSTLPLKSCNSRDVCDKLDSLTSCNSRFISDKFDSLKSCNSGDVSDKLGNVELQQDFADNKNEIISNINVEMEESCIISIGDCDENLSGITSNVKNKTEMHTFTEKQLHTNKCETSNQQLEAKIKEPEDLKVSSEEKCPDLSKNIEEKNEHHFLHGSNIPLSNDQMITQKEESMPEQNKHSVNEIENPIHFDVYTELSEKQQIVDGLSYKMLETGCPENSIHPIATVASTFPQNSVMNTEEPTSNKPVSVTHNINDFDIKLFDSSVLEAFVDNPDSFFYNHSDVYCSDIGREVTVCNFTELTDPLLGGQEELNSNKEDLSIDDIDSSATDPVLETPSLYEFLDLYGNENDRNNSQIDSQKQIIEDKSDESKQSSLGDDTSYSEHVQTESDVLIQQKRNESTVTNPTKTHVKQKKGDSIDLKTNTYLRSRKGMNLRKPSDPSIMAQSKNTSNKDEQKRQNKRKLSDTTPPSEESSISHIQPSIPKRKPQPEKDISNHLHKAESKVSITNNEKDDIGSSFHLKRSQQLGHTVQKTKERTFQKETQKAQYNSMYDKVKSNQNRRAAAKNKNYSESYEDHSLNKSKKQRRTKTFNTPHDYTRLENDSEESSSSISQNLDCEPLKSHELLESNRSKTRSSSKREMVSDSSEFSSRSACRRSSKYDGFQTTLHVLSSKSHQLPRSRSDISTYEHTYKHKDSPIFQGDEKLTFNEKKSYKRTYSSNDRKSTEAKKKRELFPKMPFRVGKRGVSPSDYDERQHKWHKDLEKKYPLATANIFSKQAPYGK